MKLIYFLPPNNNFLKKKVYGKYLDKDLKLICFIQTINCVEKGEKYQDISVTI